MKPAVFLDRDGTLIEEVSYLTRPEQVCLLPGAAEALRRLRLAGFVCVIVTNQSAVGRGMMTITDLHRVHDEFYRQLAEANAAIDGLYFCPSVDDHPDRKPNPGMLLRAAREMELDLSQSWIVGDGLRDLLAGVRAGCRGWILVRTGHPLGDAEGELPPATIDVPNIAAAADYLLALPSFASLSNFPPPPGTQPPFAV